MNGKVPPQQSGIVELNESTTAATARVGQRVRLTLAENPTTGYRWQVIDGCAAHLQLQGDQALPSDGPPGAPGKHEWVFTATSAGECRLQLQSARAWESGPASGRTMLFELRVVE